MEIESVKEVLMRRDSMTASEADELIEDAKADFINRLNNPDEYGSPLYLCEEWFGLEPDYLDEFMNLVM